MSNTKMSNIPTMTVDRAVGTLSGIYGAAVRSGISPKFLPSVMLWGPPGVGKSQLVRQVAEVLQRESGKRCVVTDVRLLLFNPIDLRGIPTADKDKKLSVWLRPKIFQMDEGADVINILFLDEISAAPQSVQAAAYQLTLDRVVGEHKLPDNCIVIAAGNRVTDKSVAYKMPKALANRLCHMEITGNRDSWMKWAVERGIHPKVMGFLSFRSDYLMCFDAATEDLAFATPRSWEMVSNILHLMGGDVEAAYDMIAGCVGTGIAMELRTWCKIYNGLPKVEDIFAGRAAGLPKETDALYALISSMTAYAREHKDSMTLIANSIGYAMRMPPDFSAVLMKNYMAIAPGYKDRLMKIPEFYRWLSTKGKMLNGTV
jgi:energy-coupling factor transporter ATP-binding protein EcfA2